ncbi:hypothetical protein [Candidatus Laterigemmans baculatus]|uniref:hypothetical protein n=1 Tax=Candidatus Laterigemmans baculatus TaxID=2770505 RepID=UPI0013DD0EB6|nr:hypothetical protein [Candidatus Laterigemmans baculatus]
MPRFPRNAACLAACLLVLLSAGCRSGWATLEQGRGAYYAGDFQSARTALTATIEQDRKLADVARLELAVVELAAGNPHASDALLRECRDAFDQRDPPEVVPSAGSLISDERDMPYDAASYEDVMIRSLLSISSLMSDSGDAESYAMQAQMRQLQLAQAAEERGLENVGEVYQPLALAPYIRGMIREATHHDYDDATRAYQLVAQWEPAFAPAQSDLLRASQGTHSQPGHGVLYVFALVGRGPQRVADVAEATGPALLIADRLVAATTQYAIPPTLAPVPIPRVVVPGSAVAAVGIQIPGAPPLRTAPLTDVGSLAVRQIEAEMPWTVARGVVRRVVKKAIVATTVDSVGGDNAALQLGGSLLGSVWEATEKPDLRCWSLLPREIQVLRVELPAGKHRFSAAALGDSGLRSAVRDPGAEAEVVIRDGANSYVLVAAPEDRVTAVVLR